MGLFVDLGPNSQIMTEGLLQSIQLTYCLLSLGFLCVISLFLIFFLIVDVIPQTQNIVNGNSYRGKKRGLKMQHHIPQFSNNTSLKTHNWFNTCILTKKNHCSLFQLCDYYIFISETFDCEVERSSEILNEDYFLHIMGEATESWGECMSENSVVKM